MSRLTLSRVPIRLGTMSDAFQPCEREQKVTLDLLETCADHDVSLVVTTKHTLLREEPWRSVWERIPRKVLVVSLLTSDPNLRQIEPFAAPPQERLAFIAEMAKTSTVLVRLSPFIFGICDVAVDDHLDALAAARARGVVSETLSLGASRLDCGAIFQKMKQAFPGFEKPIFVTAKGSYEYDANDLARAMASLAGKCKKRGLMFWSVGDDQRFLSQDMYCCGTGLIPGTKHWEATWPQLLVDAYEQYPEPVGKEWIERRLGDYGSQVVRLRLSGTFENMTLQTFYERLWEGSWDDAPINMPLLAPYDTAEGRKFGIGSYTYRMMQETLDESRCSTVGF